MFNKICLVVCCLNIGLGMIDHNYFAAAGWFVGIGYWLKVTGFWPKEGAT